MLSNTDYIVGSGAGTRVLLGCSFVLITALAGIGTAVALSRSSSGRTKPLGFVTARVSEAAVIVGTLRQDLAGATGTDTASLVTTGRSLVAVRDWTFLLGPGVMPRMKPAHPARARPAPGGASASASDCRDWDDAPLAMRRHPRTRQRQHSGRSR